MKPSLLPFAVFGHVQRTRSVVVGSPDPPGWGEPMSHDEYAAYKERLLAEAAEVERLSTAKGRRRGAAAWDEALALVLAESGRPSQGATADKVRPPAPERDRHGWNAVVAKIVGSSPERGP